MLAGATLGCVGGLGAGAVRCAGRCRIRAAKPRAACIARAVRPGVAVLVAGPRGATAPARPMTFDAELGRAGSARG